MYRTTMVWILWICCFFEKNTLAFSEERQAVLQFNIGVYCQNEVQSCDQKMLEGIQLPPAIILKVVEIPLDNALSEFDWMSHVNNLLKSAQLSLVIGKNNEILQMLTGDFRLPYLITEHLTPARKPLPDNVFNIVPQQEIVHQAIYDLVCRLGWRSVLLIYDDSTGIELMGKLLGIQYIYLKVIKVSLESDGHLKKSLVLARQMTMRNIVLVGEDQYVNTVLQEAFKLSMVSDRYSWISVKMAESNLDFSEYYYTGVNLLILDVFSKTEENQTRQSMLNNEIFAVVFKLGEMIQESRETAVKCNKLENCTSIAETESVMQSLKEVMVSSSKVFTSHNQRNNVSFRILSLQNDGFLETGEWTQDGMTGEERLSSFMPPLSEKNCKLSGQGYFRKGITRVTTLIDPPFVMLKKDYENYSGNEQYEGYLVDIMDIIAENLGMKYELYQPPDGSYGSIGDDGEWNGMINELIVGNASIMLGAVSITAGRENVVDFAKPYKQKSLNILMKKYEKELQIFQFMWPLSPIVWALILSAMAVVSLLLWLMGKTDPEHETVFNFSESLWFSYGSLVLIGTDSIPQTISGRLLSGTWWFFSMIIISSYTASLAAFLTVSKIDSPVKNLADLADQSRIKVGTVKNTATMTAFRDSNDETYKKLWSLMQDFGTDNLCDTSKTCLEKTKAGDFAFIWDTPINDYITSNECSLVTVGNPFEENMYGIGVPLGASFRDALTMEILNMNEDGTLLRLEKKWWEKGNCDPEESGTDSSTKELTMHNVAGVFILLLVGLVVSIVACAIEYRIRKKQAANEKAKDSKYKNSQPEHLVEDHLEEGTETHAIPQPVNEIEIESQM